MLLGKLDNFAPFKTPGGRGSVARARAEMKLSKYANSNGVCTAKECKGVLLITDVRAVDKATLPVIQTERRSWASRSRFAPSTVRTL
jgi:hypothetical protein